MSPPCLFLSVSLVFLTLFRSLADTLTAYQVLEQYDFPVGVLPKGVQSYELDRRTGKFKVYLNQTCAFSIRDYDLKYKSTITGVIEEDRIRKLEGISVQVLFIWFNIVKVDRKGGKLEFSVGIAGASFPVESFAESPQCGSGFDWDVGAGLKVGNVNFNFNRALSAFLE